jgi:hypothetical protein
MVSTLANYTRSHQFESLSLTVSWDPTSAGSYEVDWELVNFNVAPPGVIVQGYGTFVGDVDATSPSLVLAALFDWLKSKI